MLKHKDPNPLAIFGLRQVDKLMPHFVPVSFDLRTNEKIITDWIWENLEGRFYYGDIYCYNDQNKIGFNKTAAFEIPGEASFFALILSSINASDW